MAIILASGSPRRIELLRQAGLLFEIVPADIDEVAVEGESPEDIVRRLARDKARHVCREYPDAYVLGADTVVAFLKEGASSSTQPTSILGKPRDDADAFEMLKSLQGNKHSVFTGFSICCLSLGFSVTRSVRTDVVFARMSDSEISAYIATGETSDKAGAYAIQGIGSLFIKEIRGSYTNVVGLPLVEVLEELKNIKLWQPKKLLRM